MNKKFDSRDLSILSNETCLKTLIVNVHILLAVWYNSGFSVYSYLQVCNTRSIFYVRSTIHICMHMNKGKKIFAQLARPLSRWSIVNWPCLFYFNEVYCRRIGIPETGRLLPSKMRRSVYSSFGQKWTPVPCWVKSKNKIK